MKKTATNNETFISGYILLIKNNSPIFETEPK
jgi:hypothetical protein